MLFSDTMYNLIIFVCLLISVFVNNDCANPGLIIILTEKSTNTRIRIRLTETRTRA